MKGAVGIFIFIIIGAMIFMSLSDDSKVLRGMTGDTYNGLPEEPDASEIKESIRNANTNSIEDLIRSNFPLLDTVRSNQSVSKIYMTRQLSLSEVADLLSEKLPPEEISERQEGKQVLIYRNHFVIIEKSDVEPNLVTIELAEDSFVRNHYHPSFFQGLLAYYILDEVLDVDDWFKKRQTRCNQSGDCYSGYAMYGGFNSGNGSLRGSSNRGGGPGAGK